MERRWLSLAIFFSLYGKASGADLTHASQICPFLELSISRQPLSFLYHVFILYCQIRHVQACLWHSCCEMHLLHRMSKSSSLRLNIHQIAEYFQCSVCLVGQYAFCQYFTELYTFLIEAVYVPYEALEHDFVFEV